MYSAEISRVNPAYFIFMLDQSGSMSDPFGGGQNEISKAAACADAVNRTLANIIVQCSKGEIIRDYFYISFIGYGNKVSSCLSGILSDKSLVTVSELAEHPLRTEDRTQKLCDGVGGLVEQSVKFQVWIQQVADGGTPMRDAFSRVKSLINEWVPGHAEGYPPIILNISDGESTDGNPESLAQEIKSIQGLDGNPLIFNIHISSCRAKPIEFPATIEELPDNYARLLFRMSSELPEAMADNARVVGIPISVGSRAFVFNADAVSLINFVNIGTRPSNLR